MPASNTQDTIHVRGKVFIWNRLPTTASIQLWCELAPVTLPAIVDVLAHAPLVFVDGKAVVRNFDMSELGTLSEPLRKALKELPYARQMAIAELALRDTMLGGKTPVGKNVDVLDSIEQFYELLFRVLWLQYEGFIGVLGGLGVHLPGQTASPSEDSSTSAGPSSES